MLRIILLIAGSVFNSANAQVLLPDCGIYRTASEYQARIVFSPFKQGHCKLRQPLLHSHQVWLKSNDSLCKFSYDAIWGYRSKNKDWRVYEGEIYEITDTGKIWLYEIPAVYPAGVAGVTGYFSVAINTPIFPLDKFHLLAAYYQDTSFVHKLQKVKHQGALLKKDKRTNHYYFEQWFTL